MKKLILTLLFSLLLTSRSWGVPARPGSFNYTQPDGSVIEVELVGDEYFNYYIDVATGATLSPDANGRLTPADPATFAARKARSAARRTAANAERISRLPRMAAQAAGGPQKAIGDFGNMTGSKKGLVILVNFTDVTFKTASPQTAFTNQFNQTGYSLNGHKGSVKDYFHDQSYGAFTLDFDVVGPVTVSKAMAYYGAHSTDGDNDSHPAEMIIEAVNLANTQCGVDYSKYDWDGDGYVDQVFIIYAGYNEAQGGSANSIWPHEWNLYSANYFGDGTGPQRIDGKWIDTYACTSELAGSSGTTLDGIGTACHEFSHCLGYPDLYDTNYATNGQGVHMSYYDLMASGSYNGPNRHGEVPCGYSAYERWMAGWLNPTELTDPLTVSNMPSLLDQPKAYIIYNDNTRNEYFLLENRQAGKWFDYVSEVTGVHGLLVSHVDYNADAWSNNDVNVDASHQRFIYVPADGSYSQSSENALRGDLFPGYRKVTALTSTSHQSVNGKLFNANSAGTYTLNNQDVTEITETDGKIGFKFNGGTPDPAASLFTVTLDPGAGTVSPTSWTQTHSTATWVLPEPQCNVAGWEAVGWLTRKLTVDTPLDDILDDIIDSGRAYLPTADVTLYAVYSDASGEVCNSTPGTVPTGGDASGLTLLFGADYNSKKVQNYTSEWSATNGGFTWNIANFNNNNNEWAFVRCGNKTAASVGTITTSTAVASPVAKVVVTIDAITAGSVNSIKLKTSTTTDFTNPISTFSIDKSTGAKEVTITSPAASLYYMLEFDCAKGSSNGLVTVSKVEYIFGEGSDTPPPAPTLSSIAVTAPTKTVYTVGEALDLAGATVTATYSDNSTADVTLATTFTPADGTTLTDEGTQTVTAAYEGKTATFAVTVNPAPVPEKTVTVITFDKPEYSFFTGALGQITAYVNSGAPITYASSDENMLVIDDATGEVLAGDDEGDVTVTASVEAIGDYAAASESVTVHIVATPEEEDPDPQPAEPLFYESFDKCTGSGGNDNQWSGQIAQANINADNEGWDFVKGNGANACAKFGTGSAKGSATTPALSKISEADDHILTFKAAAWDGSSEKLKLNLSVASSDGASITPESVDLTKGAWTDYKATIKNATAATKIKFEAKNASNNRFFLDEVRVDKADGTNGIEGVVVGGDSDVPVEYYNLQGVRVKNPVAGLYIMRQGAKVAKVLVK